MSSIDERARTEMTTVRPRTRTRRVRSLAGWGLATVVVIGSSLMIAIFSFSTASTLWSSHLRWWLIGRGLGFASEITLAGVIVVGLWRRHPWRRVIGPSDQVGLLRVHATLATATIVLVGGHVASLVADPYAHVSMRGALIPFLADYRPAAVALGTVALWLIVALSMSAAMSGLIAKVPWLTLHQVAMATFVLAMAHGLATGSDVVAGRLVAIVLTTIVAALVTTGGLSRHLSRPLGLR